MVLQSVINPGSYLTIFLFVVLTGCGLPLPEEIAIVSAGVLSAVGQLHPLPAFGACLLGAVVGDAIMYAIGYHFGHNLIALHPKLGKWMGARQEPRYEQAILRHGFKVMLLSRFMVGVRGPVYLAAGVARIPFRRFLMWDLVCATLVVSLFFGVSYSFGDDIAKFLSDAERAFTLTVLAVVLVAALYALRRYRRSLLDAVLEEDLHVTNHQPEQATQPPAAPPIVRQEPRDTLSNEH
jgi:membrane protein DedA with SNARE-associated domain